MPLSAGARLGPYEILAPLGAGGMGEVYRARDTRLERIVAIKVLPSDFSADSARRKRFEVEARAVAALSHPHICPIHDVGAQGGLEYLVLELVTGETLAARLKRGPMPLAEALPRAIEMADAVAAAHRGGIIHRDLKPGNVMLSKAGAIVLDFGLARFDSNVSVSAPDATRTMSEALTEAGAVIGTLQYMAPEQLEGRPTDARTDVFAFGAVLFEMLTGRGAFEGSSAPAVMGAILRADAPSAVATQPDLPANIDRLIKGCLAKDPADRLASMHDVRLALGWIQEELNHPASVTGGSGTTRPRASGLLVPAVAATIVVAAAGYLYGRRSVPVLPHPASHVYSIPLPPPLRFWEGLALSRDGRRLAVVTQGPSGLRADPRLWIHDLNSLAAWQLVSGAGDEVPHYPFWSPDGRSLAFFLMGRLVRVEPPSVVPVEICPAPDGRGGDWIDDYTIVFAPSPASPLMRVDVRTGNQEELVPLAPNEVGLKYPSMSGARHVLYWANTKSGSDSELRLVSLDDPKHPLSVVRSAAGAVFDLGTLFYLRSGLWVGQQFDVETARFSGEPKPVAVDAPWGGNIGAPALSARAGHVAASGRGRQIVQPVWIDRTGKALGPLGDADALSDPEISPDGKRVAVSKTELSEAASDIWTLDVETGAQRRITTAAAAKFPVWSSDGLRIAFQSLTGVAGNNNVHEVTADRTRPPRVLVAGTGNLAPVGWLSDGSRFVFSNEAMSSPSMSFPRGILIQQPNGATATPIRVGGEEPIGVRLSPDGNRIAFIENGFSGTDLFVDVITGSSAHPIRVWHGAAQTPRWRADGRELFFVSSGQLMAATVSDGPILAVGKPVRLFDVSSADFTVDPTTGRFLVMQPTSTPAPTVTVTLNWPR